LSTGTTQQPNLPLAPAQYSPQFFDDLLKILRLYFQQLDNPGICQASTNYSGAKILSAMNFSTLDTAGIQQVSLPTQLDIAKLRTGDLYYDTAANNVIKIKV
jgi:hypothetical protein